MIGQALISFQIHILDRTDAASRCGWGKLVSPVLLSMELTRLLLVESGPSQILDSVKNSLRMTTNVDPTGRAAMIASQ